MRSTTASAENIHFQTSDFGFEVSTADLRSQKNNNPDQIIRRHRGHDMVHRTDIAGSAVCSRGRVGPGDDGSCRHAPSGALIERVFYRKPLPLRTSAARSAAV